MFHAAVAIKNMIAGIAGANLFVHVFLMQKV